MAQPTQTTLSDARVAEGLAHYGAGRFREAEALFRLVAADNPNHSESLCLLAMAENQLGRRDSALSLLTRAAQLAPQNADLHNNLGLMLSAAGRREEAIPALAAAVRNRPAEPKFHYDLGNVLLMSGRIDPAMAEYRTAITLNPQFADAYQNLGCALHRKGMLDDAEAHLRRAIAIAPSLADAHNNLGGVLSAKMRLLEAVDCYNAALRLRPNFSMAMANLGSTLRLLGRTQEAITLLRRAIELSPNLPEAYNNLGICLKEEGKIDEAVGIYLKCLSLRPTMGDATNNLGNAYKDAGNVRDAVAYYSRAIALGFADPGVHSNLTYTLQFHPGYDDESLYREQRRWNDIYAAPLRHLIRPHDNGRSPDRKLRIGYVSPYFYHQAESFFVLPLLKNHDRDHFEVHCYSSVVRPDQMTQQLQAMAHVWHNVLGVKDPELAEMIRRDRIDVLIDLSMHMAHNRMILFARKSAPVQVTWLAYPGGTGLDAMDYRITDAYMDPPGKNGAHYREESYRLEDCWVCYDPCSETPPAIARPDGPIRFGSINNPCKNNDGVMTLWSRLMSALPGSRLLIQSFSESDRQRIRGIFQSAGVGPERIEFVPRRGRLDYLRLYDSIDIGLDPLPYNGITTTCDALWMGVPVVTLAGKTAAGRAGLSILSTVGMPELIGHSEEEFLRIATGLASDAARLEELRRTLRLRMQNSPLMDGAGFARKMESAYRHMWRQWCMKQP